jgi:hypothetical protein
LTTYIAVPAGGSGEFAFQIRHAPSNTLGGAVGGRLEVPVAVFNQYAFTPLDPAACPAPTLVSTPTMQVVRFAFAPGGSTGPRTCRYRVERPSDAASDLGFNVCLLETLDMSPTCVQRVRIGSLYDQELALEGVGVGSADPNLLQLRLINRSLQKAASRTASTDCHMFGDGVFGTTRFDFDSNIPGGCPSSVSNACIDFTGPPFTIRRFHLGPAPPGGSSTCLVRVVPRANPGVDRVRLYLLDDIVGLPGNAFGFDPRREREAVMIGLDLFGAAAVAVPVGPAVVAGIALSLLLVGVVVLRSRGGRGRST